MGESDYHCDDNVVAKSSWCSPHTATRVSKGPALANPPAAQFFLCEGGRVWHDVCTSTSLMGVLSLPRWFFTKRRRFKISFFGHPRTPRALSDARGMGKSKFMLVPDCSACVTHGALAGHHPRALGVLGRCMLTWGSLAPCCIFLCEYGVLSVYRGEQNRTLFCQPCWSYEW